MPSLSFEEILQVHRERLHDAGREAAPLSHLPVSDLTPTGTKFLATVEATVVTAYRLAVAQARKADSPEEAQAVWQGFSRLCVTALQFLELFDGPQPQMPCVALRDLVQKYQLAAEQRRQRLEEEMACLKTPLPEGLLPAPN